MVTPPGGASRRDRSGGRELRRHFFFAGFRLPFCGKALESVLRPVFARRVRLLPRRFAAAVGEVAGFDFEAVRATFFFARVFFAAAFTGAVACVLAGTLAGASAAVAGAGDRA